MINIRIGDKSENTAESVLNRINRLEGYLKKLNFRINQKQEKVKQSIAKMSQKEKDELEKNLKKLDAKYSQ